MTARTVPLLPALRQWRREIRGGRHACTFDALWAAACEDANAREWLQYGFPTFATRALERARLYRWAV